jgi:hypothetical protein
VVITVIHNTAGYPVENPYLNIINSGQGGLEQKAPVPIWYDFKTQIKSAFTLFACGKLASRSGLECAAAFRIYSYCFRNCGENPGG